MITTTYAFGSGSGFNFDSSKIGFNGTLADLILQDTPEVFTQNYAASTGFTFNASNTEFTAGVMRQKNQVPANLAAYAAWNTFLNVNYGSSTLTVTAFNSAAVSGGFLDLTGSTNKYVQLPDAYIVGNQATLAFIIKPNYSGNPSVYQIIYGNGTFPVNYFALYHSPAGTLSLDVYDSAGAAIISGVSFGTWVPVSGASYEMVLQVDVTNGATKLFIDGVQFGSTIASIGVRTTALSAFVGRDGTNSGNADFSIKSFAIYSAVVGPASITPLADSIYVADIITFPTFTYALAANLVAFTAATITDVNSPTYALNSKWWNGSMWTTSNLTAAQSNSAAQIVANIATFPASNTVIITAFTSNAAVQQSFSLFNLNYTGLLYPTTNPSISPNIPLTLDQITQFITNFSASGSDGVKWFLRLNSSNFWWNGAAWAASNGTYAQANIDTDIADNIASLPVTLGVFFTPFALLHSADGLTTPTLTSLTLTYDFFGERPGGPNLCTVFGYIIDESDNVVPGATVKVLNPTTVLNQGLVMAQGYLTVISDSIGYFSITLAETTTIDALLTFSVTYPTTVSKSVGNNAYTFGNAKVPNTPEANITSLVFS